MYCANCGTELGETARFCSECGTAVGDHDVGDGAGTVQRAASREPEPDAAPAEGSTTIGVAADSTGSAAAAEAAQEPATASDSDPTFRTTTIPADAAAIDVTCQHCGDRPIEEIASGHRVTGLVLFYSVKSYRLIGCHRCVRRKLLGMTAKNLVVGWWGLRAALLNAGFTIKNLGRAAMNRGPNANLVESLDDVGVTYDFLADPDDFDPAQHSRMELYVRSFVRLGTAIMLADGEVNPEERAVIHDAVTEIFPDAPADRLDDLIARAARSPADIERVAEGLGEILTPDGQRLAIGFVAEVVDAGVTGDEDVELASAIAHGMGLDEDDIRSALAEPARPAA